MRARVSRSVSTQSRNVRFGCGAGEFRFKVRSILDGVAPVKKRQGRGEGVGSGAIGNKPSVDTKIRRGLSSVPELLWWNSGAEALHRVNAKTAGLFGPGAPYFQWNWAAFHAGMPPLAAIPLILRRLASLSVRCGLRFSRVGLAGAALGGCGAHSLTARYRF